MARHIENGWACIVVQESDPLSPLYDSDGNIRVLPEDSESPLRGLYAPNGALRVGSDGSSAYTPSGALNGTLNDDNTIFVPVGM